MRVPLGWLAEWVPLPPRAEALAEALTSAGLEVDAIERSGPDLSGLRVGRVLERGPHPDAERLSLCRVDVGEGDPREIVCGAPNVASGQKVAVALPGARLPDGTKLKKTRIRGVTSNGMICSARELGLGEDHAGILVLDPNAPVGAPLSDVVSGGETVLDVSLTPNRGDCASLLGIAREVSALCGGEIALPACEPLEGDRPVSDDVRVEVEDGEGCWRYVARVVRGVRVAPSPDWLAKRLEAAGLRPINVVVDVTNYVLLELGQPLHAFDLDTLAGGRVRVRAAAEGEKLATLDGETRSLVPDDLVIADAERAIAVAGVMGGAETEVTGRTTNVLIESAQFAPTRVRRAARRLGLATDASYRFERGVDRHGVARAADRAARLLAELAGGEVSAGRAEARGAPPPVVEEVDLELARVNRLLGSDLDREAVEAALARVGVESREARPGWLRCRIPSHRNDLALPQDLIEEVVRVRGYAALPARIPAAPLERGSLPPTWTAVETARDALVREGLTEVMSFPFLDPRDLDRLGLPEDDPRRAVPRVLNPLNEPESRLRSTILPTLLGILRDNRHRQLDRVGIFEVSRIFLAAGGTSSSGAVPGEAAGAGGPGALSRLPREGLRVTAVLGGGERADLWERAPTPLFFQAKGAAERLAAALGHGASFEPGAVEPWLHPGAACALRAGERGERLGSLGELHPEVAAAFEIDVPCAVIDLDLAGLAALPREVARYREVSPFPSARRDLAVLVDASLPAGEVLEAVRRQAGPLLLSAELFDRYEGRGVPDGKVSLAFRLVFQHAERTLKDAEVQKAVDKVIKMLAHRFGGELRQ